MASLNDFTDEELGKMLREAARGKEQEAIAALDSQYSLAEFLEQIGLFDLAEMILEAASAVWDGIKEFFRNLFRRKKPS
jgi:hypothetical protein